MGDELEPPVEPRAGVIRFACSVGVMPGRLHVLVHRDGTGARGLVSCPPFTRDLLWRGDGSVVDLRGSKFASVQ
jgi:hypothetical protein